MKVLETIQTKSNSFRCGPGTYWVPRLELCEPCPCNGFIDDTDLDSCDPITGECLKCLDNRSGKFCERCAKFYFNSTLGDCTCEATCFFMRFS